MELFARLALGAGGVACLAYAASRMHGAFDKRMQQRNMVAAASAQLASSDPKKKQRHTKENLDAQAGFSSRPPTAQRESLPTLRFNAMQSDRLKAGETLEPPATKIRSHHHVPVRDGVGVQASDLTQAGEMREEPNASRVRFVRDASNRPVDVVKPKVPEDASLQKLNPEASQWLAPDVRLIGFPDNQIIRMADLRGKVVILDFWASWCAPCLRELPMLAELVATYPEDDLQMFAVNSEEPARTVAAMRDQLPSDLKLALDSNGVAAAAFGVEALPTLVLIDENGFVQRIHIGFEDDLKVRLASEIDALIGGNTLAPDPNVIARRHDVEGSAGPDDTRDHATVPHLHAATPDQPLVLSTGRQLPVGKIFQEAKANFDKTLDQTLERNDERVTTINYLGSQQASLILGRRGSRLHGPLASFNPDGTLLACLNYRYGKRNSDVLTWDDAGRPYVLEQYLNGRRDGYRVLFKSCSEACDTGHVWLVQEWDHGDLMLSHLAMPDGTSATVTGRSVSNLASSQRAEFVLAKAQLDEFESRLDGDEEKLQTMVSEYYVSLRQKVQQQAQARLASSRIGLGNMISSGPGRQYGQGSNFGFTPSRSTIRNCGRS